MKTLSFSHIKFSDLLQIVDLRQITNDQVFREWFSYGYAITPEETAYLQELITANRPFMMSYSEEELKIRFIGPLLNKVNYWFNETRDWYHRPLKAKINNVTLRGYVDFMVAKGIKEPVTPYFFIQEFKKTKIDIDPEDQLLAEMLVALALNDADVMHGAYIIGPQWRFVTLQKIEHNRYEYYVSLIFDSQDIEELQQIYTHLHAVKHLFCKDGVEGGDI